VGKKSTKTTSTSTPWAPAQGDILGAIGSVRDVVNNNQGNLQGIASGIGAQLPSLANKAFGDSPALKSAFDYTQNVLGGNYLQNNPYLDQMIARTNADVGDQVNSLFGRSGASLGTQHAGVLTKNLADSENNFRYTNYANERQNQQQAASLMPALYGSQFVGVSPYLAAAQTAGTLPYAGIGALSPIIGLAGGSGQTKGTQPGGWGNDLLNAAASIGSAAILASDRKLKTNIKKIGEASDGLGIYTWNWKSDPNGQRARGVIADEVKHLRPWAYVENYQGKGFDAVNYGTLGSMA
jgi:hypothetical protein